MLSSLLPSPNPHYTWLRTRPPHSPLQIQNSSIKELLTLSRKIKELWVFGSLGQGNPEKRAVETQMDADVAQVAELMNGLEGRKMGELAARWGGTWEVLG